MPHPDVATPAHLHRLTYLAPSMTSSHSSVWLRFNAPRQRRFTRAAQTLTSRCKRKSSLTREIPQACCTLTTLYADHVLSRSRGLSLANDAIVENCLCDSEHCQDNRDLHVLRYVVSNIVLL